MPGPKPPEWWLTLAPKESRPSREERHKPYLGLREPRFLRGYPMPIRSMIQRHGGAIRRKLLRQKRPRRHARAPKGAKTGLDVQMSMEARASQEVKGSLEERIFYQALIDNGFNPGADFDFQANEFGGRAELGGLVADFLFEYPKIVVQVQSYWHLINTEIEQRDLDQTAMLQSLGYSVLQLWPDVIHSQARLDWWIEQNISHLWGTSSHPTVGQNTRDEAYAEGFGMYAELLKQISAISKEWAEVQADRRLDKLESALFGTGGGPEVRITSAYIAKVLSSANYVSGVSGWRIQQSGDAEFNNVTVRGVIKASSFKLRTTTGMGGTLVIGSATCLDADVEDATTTVITVKDDVFWVGAFIKLQMSATEMEVMKVTAKNGVSLTVTRGVAGTAQVWKKGTGISAISDRVQITVDQAETQLIEQTAWNTGVAFINYTQRQAACFTPTATADWFTGAEWYVYWGFQPQSVTFSVELWDSTGGDTGTPNNLLASDVLNWTGPTPPDHQWVVWTPASPVRLTPGQKYWFSIGYYSGQNFCAFRHQDTDVLANTHRGYRDSFGVWGEVTYHDGTFRVHLSGDAPVVDVIDWTGPLYTDETLKCRLGFLTGISDPDMTPTGYGLYSSNAFLSGTAVFGGGAITLDSSGITISEGAATENKITWYDATQEFTPAEIYGESFLDSVYHGRVVIKAADKAAAAVLNLKLDTKQEALILDGDAAYQAKEQSSAPATPASGYRGLYAKDDGWYDLDDAGASLKIGSIVGEIRMWATGTAPTGWLLCQGQAVSRTTYSALFTVIGTTFGVGDGSTTFNLPDFQDRSPQGASGTDAIGAQVGLKDQTTVPSHRHSITAHTGPDGGSKRITYSNNHPSETAYTFYTEYTGAASVDQRGPRLAINFIIKY